MLYIDEDEKRVYYDYPDCYNIYENPFESDCNRLIQSPSFRRLQGKIQIFPGIESDFFRNRLTHSLEVNVIAQQIVRKLNIDLDPNNKINHDVVRFACFAHDLGHPPFGHDGEKALNECMAGNGGFEGNAQTLRILSIIERGPIFYASDNNSRNGLNITYRCLASIIKKAILIPKEPIYETDEKLKTKKLKTVKGIYYEDKELIENIFQDKLVDYSNPDEENKYLKQTIECQIMDIADDISNAIHDLEDSLKGGFINPFDLFFPKEDILKDILKEINKNKKNESYIDRQKLFEALNQIFETTDILSGNSAEDWKELVRHIYNSILTLSNNGFDRNIFIKRLSNKFVNAIKIKNPDQFDKFSEIEVDSQISLQISVLKKFHQLFQHNSTKSYVSGFRGKQIIKKLFETFKENPELMAEDYYKWYKSVEDEKEKIRIICDFIAGMTDNYCIEMYSRLFSERPQSIFKPI